MAGSSAIGSGQQAGVQQLLQLAKAVKAGGNKQEDVAVLTNAVNLFKSQQQGDSLNMSPMGAGMPTESANSAKAKGKKGQKAASAEGGEKPKKKKGGIFGGIGKLVSKVAKPIAAIASKIPLPQAQGIGMIAGLASKAGDVMQGGKLDFGSIAGLAGNFFPGAKGILDKVAPVIGAIEGGGNPMQIGQAALGAAGIEVPKEVEALLAAV